MAILVTTIVATLPAQSFVSDDGVSRAATVSAALTDANLRRTSDPGAPRQGRFPGIVHDVNGLILLPYGGWFASDDIGLKYRSDDVVFRIARRRLVETSDDIDAVGAFADGTVIAFLSADWGENRSIRLVPDSFEDGYPISWRCISNVDHAARRHTDCSPPPPPDP